MNANENFTVTETRTYAHAIGGLCTNEREQLQSTTSMGRWKGNEIRSLCRQNGINMDFVLFLRGDCAYVFMVFLLFVDSLAELPEGHRALGLYLHLTVPLSLSTEYFSQLVEILVLNTPIRMSSGSEWRTYTNTISTKTTQSRIRNTTQSWWPKATQSCAHIADHSYWNLISNRTIRILFSRCILI